MREGRRKREKNNERIKERKERKGKEREKEKKRERREKEKREKQKRESQLKQVVAQAKIYQILKRIFRSQHCQKIIIALELKILVTQPRRKHTWGVRLSDFPKVVLTEVKV